ncbi:Sdh6p [Sporobolomyces salmoneus]|uniref:Sdh6p n=1 Tax=Sporobolomyces salmoneus TaxID=183962 RepID=UPI00316F62AC
MARRISGLQRQVLSLYKRSLQMVQSKPLDKRPAFYQFVAHQFRHPTAGGGVRKKDVQTIEYLMRKGEKQLESYSSSGVKNVVLPEESEIWPEGWVAKGGKERKNR